MSILRALFQTLGFLSILPLGKLAHFESRHVPAMLCLFPLAGALLGALLGLIWFGLSFLRVPAHVTAALMSCSGRF